jgi:glycerophosphoryl diester phosphodiesterase
LHQLHPENSAGAFSAAWQGGVRWCECDIHFTADGVPVVIHDETLRRTTILTGAISEMNWADISRTLLIGCNCQPTVEKLPSLLAIIQLIPADRGLIIEIKPPVAAEMVLKNLPRGDERIMLQSFDETNLARLRDTGCEFPLALLVEDELSLLRAIDSPWESVRAKHSLLTPEIIGRINRSGKSVGAWTVNDPAEMRRLADLGVDMLITDFPLVAKEVLGID